MAEHQYAATGFAGNGMTFGTLGGDDGADAILGRANPWAELFDPGRKALARGLWDYLKENEDYPYYLIRDRFAGARGALAARGQRGQGKVIEHDGQKVAAYRDEDGVVDAALGDLHAHGLPGRLERRRADVGLPVPRLAVHTAAAR